MLITGPRGANDILPSASSYWHYVEQAARNLCEKYNYQEIRTPIFEHTELFLRGIGDTTDVVQKEMYTFNDRGGRSVTLRPENTASVVRAFLEHKLYANSRTQKVYYMGPMFRYDRPQAGRLRQFHQFGIEAIGSPGPAIDAEVIAVAVDYFKGLGLSGLQLFVNSVGCPKCRPGYRERLQKFLQDKREQLCENCQSRFERNPMRILDCKEEKCGRLSVGAPEMIESLCDECATHFDGVKNMLEAGAVEYQINPRLVRGLDYYTKTAFEIQFPLLGAQSAICGGGRYDGLIEQCGGPSTPGIGFAIGLERVLLAMEKQGCLQELANKIDVFLIPLGEAAMVPTFALMQNIRSRGISADMDYMERGLKARMKMASQSQAKFAIIMGDDEVNSGKIMLKNMQTSEQISINTAVAAEHIEREMRV